MKNEQDNNQPIESILGKETGSESLQFTHTRVAVALYTKSSSVTTHKHQVSNLPNVCYQNNALDVSGLMTTANNGKCTFRLTDFICTQGELFNNPINVIVTPHSSKPFFLTVKQALLNNGANVEITVFAWDANGVPAPGVTFNWRCRVELPIIIL